MSHRFSGAAAALFCLIFGFSAAESQPPTRDVVYLALLPADVSVTARTTNLLDAAESELERRGIEVFIFDEAAHSDPAAALPRIEINASQADVSLNLFMSAQNWLSDISPILTAAAHDHSFSRFGYPGFSDRQFVAAAVSMGLYAVGRCDEAVVELDRLLTDLDHPGSTGAQIVPLHFLRGNCAIGQGDYETAIVSFERIPCVNQPYQVFAINLGWVHIQTGQSERAFERLNDCMRFATDDAEQIFYLTRRSQLHALAFQFDAAIADMNATLELDPANPSLYFERAQRILLLYEWDRVLADYNRALELDPEYAAAYFHRGLLFYTQGPREQALPDFERYLDLAPDGAYADEARRSIESIRIEITPLADQ